MSRSPLHRLLLATLGALAASGCAAPSNIRNWSPELAVLPYAEFSGNQVTVHNIRNCQYLTEKQFVVEQYDRTFDLDQLQSVDFFSVPFIGMPALAHTMLSFGFAGDQYLGVSAEVRLEQGEEYELVKGLMHQYELIYVVADERDLLKLRVDERKVDVYRYRCQATPQQARELFVDVFQRVNKLAVQPEYYDTFTNNCTTNIVGHVNHLKPKSIPMSIGVLLPGYADVLAYNLGLIEHRGTYAETRQKALINAQVARYRDEPDFSAKIRQPLEPEPMVAARPSPQVR